MIIPATVTQLCEDVLARHGIFESNRAKRLPPLHLGQESASEGHELAQAIQAHEEERR